MDKNKIINTLKTQTVNNKVGKEAEIPIVSSRRIHVGDKDEIEGNIEQEDIKVAVDQGAIIKNIVMILIGLAFGIFISTTINRISNNKQKRGE